MNRSRSANEFGVGAKEQPHALVLHDARTETRRVVAVGVPWPCWIGIRRITITPRILPLRIQTQFQTDHYLMS